jgi:hypothetical protein
VIEFVILAGILLWLRSDFMLGLLAQVDENLGPAWRQAYLLLVLATAAGLVAPLVTLVKPRWTQFRRVTQLVVGTVWLIAMVYLVLMGDWSVQAGASVELGQVAENLGRYVWYGVLFSLVGVAVASTWDAVVVWRGRRR